jgi:hypothetical protein
MPSGFVQAIQVEDSDDDSDLPGLLSDDVESEGSGSDSDDPGHPHGMANGSAPTAQAARPNGTAAVATPQANGHAAPRAGLRGGFFNTNRSSTSQSFVQQVREDDGDDEDSDGPPALNSGSEEDADDAGSDEDGSTALGTEAGDSDTDGPPELCGEGTEVGMTLLRALMWLEHWSPGHSVHVWAVSSEQHWKGCKGRERQFSSRLWFLCCHLCRPGVTRRG